MFFSLFDVPKHCGHKGISTVQLQYVDVLTMLKLPFYPSFTPTQDTERNLFTNLISSHCPAGMLSLVAGTSCSGGVSNHSFCSKTLAFHTGQLSTLYLHVLRSMVGTWLREHHLHPAPRLCAPRAPQRFLRCVFCSVISLQTLCLVDITVLPKMLLTYIILKKCW